LPLRWRGRSMKPTGCCVAGRSTMKRPMCAAQFATTTTLRTATITSGFGLGLRPTTKRPCRAPLRSTPEWAEWALFPDYGVRWRCRAAQGLPESCTAEVWRRSTTCSWPRQYTWPGCQSVLEPPRSLPLPRLGRGNLFGGYVLLLPTFRNWVPGLTGATSARYLPLTRMAVGPAALWDVKKCG